MVMNTNLIKKYLLLCALVQLGLYFLQLIIQSFIDGFGDLFLSFLPDFQKNRYKMLP